MDCERRPAKNWKIRSHNRELVKLLYIDTMDYCLVIKVVFLEESPMLMIH
jgi:hypothetical protein